MTRWVGRQYSRSVRLRFSRRAYLPAVTSATRGSAFARRPELDPACETDAKAPERGIRAELVRTGNGEPVAIYVPTTFTFQGNHDDRIIAGTVHTRADPQWRE